MAIRGSVKEKKEEAKIVELVNKLAPRMKDEFEREALRDLIDANEKETWRGKSTIWFEDTRLSEQPIHRYSGFCCLESLAKKSGSDFFIFSAHFLLFSKRFSRIRMVLALLFWWKFSKDVMLRIAGTVNIASEAHLWSK